MNPQVLLPWCSPLAAALPRRLAEALADGCGGAWRSNPQLRSNLESLLGCSPAPSLLRQARRHYARYYLGIMRLAHADLERACGTVALRGEAHLRRTLASGHGALVLSAHFGNWDVAAAALARHFGNLLVFAEAIEHTSLARFYRQVRARHGVEVVAGERSRLPVRWLRQNRIIGVVADRAFGAPSLRVPFGRTQLEVPAAAIRLALRSGAGIHTVLCVREGTGHVLHIGPDLTPLPHRGPGRQAAPARPPIPAIGRDADARTVACQFAATLTDRIREHPGQWCHLHPLVAQENR